MREIIRNGIKFLVNTNTANADFWNIDDWEADNYQTVFEISKETNTFVNAGSWIGPFTLFAANLFDNVYGLEPDPLAFKELEDNVNLNNFKNVKLFNKAFNNKSEIISLGSNYSELGKSGTSIFQIDNAFDVESLSLRNFFETESIPKNSLLMLDVEGAEYLLFDDYTFFETYRPIILLSLHLTFLTDEHFYRLINNFVKLIPIYNFDFLKIINDRQTTPYGGPFTEINILMQPKKYEDTCYNK